jgi:hypothetical protein
MLEILFFIAVGIVIGWNLPQPPWARELQDKAVRAIRDLTARKPGA